MLATQIKLTEWRLLFTDENNENPRLGDIVYYNRHGAITGRAMRRHADHSIQAVKVQIEIIETEEPQ